MTTYKQAAKAVAWVIFFHILGMIALYSWYPYYDVPMHFGGGVAMAVLALALWDHVVLDVRFKLKQEWLSKVFFAGVVLGFVGLIGIGWEWMEFILAELTRVNSWSGLVQMGLGDSLADLFFDLLGALCVILWRRV